MHADHTPVILKAMQQAVADGTLVNPPIWWVDPTNKEAHKINDGKLIRIYRIPDLIYRIT